MIFGADCGLALNLCDVDRTKTAAVGRADNR